MGEAIFVAGRSERSLGLFALRESGVKTTKILERLERIEITLLYYAGWL